MNQSYPRHINFESVPNFRDLADTGRGTGARWHGGGFSEVRSCIPVGERLVAESILRDHAAAGALVELPVQTLREREVLGVCEGLVAEDEHGEFVHAGANFCERLLVVHHAKLDRAGLTDEHRVKLPEGERHGLQRVGRGGPVRQAIGRQIRAERPARRGPLGFWSNRCPCILTRRRIRRIIAAA
jgi:hypothetical protein